MAFGLLLLVAVVEVDTTAEAVVETMVVVQEEMVVEAVAELLDIPIILLVKEVLRIMITTEAEAAEVEAAAGAGAPARNLRAESSGVLR